MDRRTVAVVAFFVSLAGSEVEGAGDFFVEENIAHRLLNIRIEAEGKFAHVARARIGVENLI